MSDELALKAIKEGKRLIDEVKMKKFEPAGIGPAHPFGVAFEKRKAALSSSSSVPGLSQGTGAVSESELLRRGSSTTSEKLQPNVAPVWVAVPSASHVVVSSALFTKLEFAKNLDRVAYIDSWKDFPNGFNNRWFNIPELQRYLNEEYLKSSSGAREQTIRWLFSIVQKCISVAPKGVSVSDKHKKSNEIFGGIEYKIRLALVEFIGKNFEEVKKIPL